MPLRSLPTSPTWLFLAQFRPTSVLWPSIGLTLVLAWRCQNENRIQWPAGTSHVTVPSGAVFDVRSTSELGSRIVEVAGGLSRLAVGPGVITRAAVTAISLPVRWLLVSPSAGGAC